MKIYFSGSETVKENPGSDIRDGAENDLMMMHKMKTEQDKALDFIRLWIKQILY